MLPYILPKLWTSRIRQGYNWDEIHEDALAAINVDLIRSIDWRFDLILSRLNRGPRLCNPDLDFRYERITGPGFYPKLFIRFWVMRPLTGAILLLTAGLLAVNGWIFAHWCIAAPVYVVGIYIFFRILWAGFAGTLSQTRSLKLVTAFLEDSISANLERRPMLGMPDPTICRRLASALRAKNAASVDIFCRQFLTDVLAHVDKFQHRAVIDEQIIPILQKHFGNPLPKLLQDALDNYEFSD